MQIFDTPLCDVKLIQSKRFGDERGWFAEVFHTEKFAALGLPASFAQDNQSRSVRGVLRGLHYQLGKPQGKLVRVVSGRIWDVAVDIRPESPEYGRHAAFDLTPDTPGSELRMLWIPEGYAHGFLVLSETAEVLYKTTDVYYPAGERCIRWNDPDLAIPWPVQGLEVQVSSKDADGASFAEAEKPGLQAGEPLLRESS